MESTLEAVKAQTSLFARLGVSVDMFARNAAMTVERSVLTDAELRKSLSDGQVEVTLRDTPISQTRIDDGVFAAMPLVPEKLAVMESAVAWIIDNAAKVTNTEVYGGVFAGDIANAATAWTSPQLEPATISTKRTLIFAVYDTTSNRFDFAIASPRATFDAETAILWAWDVFTGDGSPGAQGHWRNLLARVSSAARGVHFHAINNRSPMAFACDIMVHMLFQGRPPSDLLWGGSGPLILQTFGLGKEGVVGQHLNVLLHFFKTALDVEKPRLITIAAPPPVPLSTWKGSADAVDEDQDVPQTRRKRAGTTWIAQGEQKIGGSTTNAVANHGSGATGVQGRNVMNELAARLLLAVTMARKDADALRVDIAVAVGKTLKAGTGKNAPTDEAARERLFSATQRTVGAALFHGLLFAILRSKETPSKIDPNFGANDTTGAALLADALQIAALYGVGNYISASKGDENAQASATDVGVFGRLHQVARGIEGKLVAWTEKPVPGAFLGFGAKPASTTEVFSPNSDPKTVDYARKIAFFATCLVACGVSAGQDDDPQYLVVSDTAELLSRFYAFRLQGRSNGKKISSAFNATVRIIATLFHYPDEQRGELLLLASAPSLQQSTAAAAAAAASTVVPGSASATPPSIPPSQGDWMSMLSASASQQSAGPASQQTTPQMPSSASASPPASQTWDSQPTWSASPPAAQPSPPLVTQPTTGWDAPALPPTDPWSAPASSAPASATQTTPPILADAWDKQPPMQSLPLDTSAYSSWTSPEPTPNATPQAAGWMPLANAGAPSRESRERVADQILAASSAVKTAVDLARLLEEILETDDAEAKVEELRDQAGAVKLAIAQTKGTAATLVRLAADIRSGPAFT